MKKAFLTAAAFSVALTAVITGCGKTAVASAVSSTTAGSTVGSSAAAETTTETTAVAVGQALENTGYKPDVKVAPKAAKVKTTEDKVTNGYGFERGNLGDVTLAKGDTFARVKIKNYGTIDFKLYKDLTPVAFEHFTKDTASGYYSNKKIHRVMSNFMFQGGSENGDGLSKPGEVSFAVEATPELRHFYGALCYANAGGRNGTQFYVVNAKKYAAPDADVNSKEQSSEYIAMFEKMQQYLALSESERKTSDIIPAEQKEYVSSLGESEAEYKEFVEEQLKYHKSAVAEADNAANKYKKTGGANFLDGDYTVFGQAVNGFDVIDKLSAIETSDNGSGEKSKPINDVVIESVQILTKE